MVTSPIRRRHNARLLGIDFSSRPTPAKPIVCARAVIDRNRLVVLGYLRLADLAAFEALLAVPGPWIAGMDFPFGQPRRLIENLDWPRTWGAYVAHIGAMGRTGFEKSLEDYRRPRPAGDKQHLRLTDRLAGARSPMMLHRVPVGKMFFEGAQRIFRATVCVVPCRPIADDRIAVEAYPALVARSLIGRQTYKSDCKHSDDHENFCARQKILSALKSYVARHLGLTLEYRGNARRLALQDPRGDTLDALLCAIAAAWSWTRRHRNYGIPEDADALEGWIVDPAGGGDAPRRILAGTDRRR